MTIIPEATKILDVREDIRSGREPFSLIIDAATQLKEGESLCLIVPLERVPAEFDSDQVSVGSALHPTRRPD